MKQPVFTTESMIKTYVLYDTRSGEIVHVHEYLALPGAPQPADTELETEACAVASRITSKSISEIGSLRVRREEFQIGAQYVVDLEKKTIVIKDRLLSKGTSA